MQPTSERYDSQHSFGNKMHKSASVTDPASEEMLSSSRPTPYVQMYGAVDQTHDNINVEGPEQDENDEEARRMSNAVAEGETFATLDDDTRTDDTRKSYQASLN